MLKVITSRASMARPVSCLLSCLAAAFTVATTPAEPIYDNGAPDNFHGGDITTRIQADDFTLTAATRLDSVKFWEFEAPASFAGSFTWQIYATSADDSPGAVLFSGTSKNLTRIPTGFSPFGSYQEVLVAFDFGPVTLPAGKYWLGLHNGPLSYYPPTVFIFWEASASIGTSPNHESIPPLNDFWYRHFRPPTEFAFELSGVALPRVTAITTSNGGVPRINFTSKLGETYRVEYKNALADSSWTPVTDAELIQGTGDPIQVSDPTLGNRPLRFYRVVLR